MQVVLRRLVIFVRTASDADNGTDGSVMFVIRRLQDGKEFVYKLDNPDDDRERGKTDRYDIRFTTARENPTFTPQQAGNPVMANGVSFTSWQAMKDESEWKFFLECRSTDAWTFDSCFVLGYVQTFDHEPEPQIDDGRWILLSAGHARGIDASVQLWPNDPVLIRAESAVTLSADPREADSRLNLDQVALLNDYIDQPQP